LTRRANHRRHHRSETRQSHAVALPTRSVGTPRLPKGGFENQARTPAGSRIKIILGASRNKEVPSSSVQNSLLDFHAMMRSPDVRGLRRQPRPPCWGFSFELETQKRRSSRNGSRKAQPVRRSCCLLMSAFAGETNSTILNPRFWPHCGPSS